MNGSGPRSGNRAIWERPGPFEFRPGLPGGRDADQGGLEPGEERREPFAGVDPAGLFRSDDGGATWRHIAGLTKSSVAAALESGRRRAHPPFHAAPSRDGKRCGSASPPSGCSIGPMAARPGKRATRAPGPTSCRRTSDIPNSANACTALSWLPACRTGCISKTIAACTSATTGVGRDKHRRGPALEFRLSGGGPSARPRDALSAAVERRLGGRFVPDGKVAVWRTRDGGETWQDLRKGLPQGVTYFGVLREAMATDRLEPAGVYFGTSTGALYGSADEGDSWTCDRRAPSHCFFGRDDGGRGRAPCRKTPHFRRRGEASGRLGQALPGGAAPASRYRRRKRTIGDLIDALNPAGRACATASATRRPASAAT